MPLENKPLPKEPDSKEEKKKLKVPKGMQYEKYRFFFNIVQLKE